MAELNMPQKRGKKTSLPRVDLTPMVDLGFLLITFFMYTTTMAKPHVMDIRMPSNEHTDDPNVVIEESTITVIPVKDHRVVYYEGSLKDASQLKDCSMPGIRDVLLKKKKQVENLPASYSANAHKMYVLIKPASTCHYDDLVHVLDEMSIGDVPGYTLMDESAEEIAMIEKKY
jgi:biopolymer transport protein ExbD